MDKTTVKRYAFAFIFFYFQNWDTRLFSAVNTRFWHHPPRAGIRPAVELPYGQVGTVFPEPVGAYDALKVYSWWLVGLICTVPERSAMQREPSLQSPDRVFVLLLCVSGEIYLRLKLYLVVKISFDIVTKHCCQVCVLSMTFCCSESRLCAEMVSDQDCTIGKLEYHVVWLHSDRPTWEMIWKIFFTFDFHILP